MLAKLFCATIFLFSFSCQAAVALNPYKLVETVAQKTLQRIEKDEAKIKADPSHLNVVVKEELMPFIDYQFAGKVVLDKNRPDDALRDQFLQAFERHLIATYAAIFSKYDGQKLSLAPEQNFTGKKIVAVKGQLTGKSEQVFDIEFKLKFDKQDKQWAVFDLVVEGISMLSSKKAEFSPILRKPDGVQAAIDILNKKAKEAGLI